MAGTQAVVHAAVGACQPGRQNVLDWGTVADAACPVVLAGWAAISHGPDGCVGSWAEYARDDDEDAVAGWAGGMASGFATGQ